MTWFAPVDPQGLRGTPDDAEDGGVEVQLISRRVTELLMDTVDQRGQPGGGEDVLLGGRWPRDHRGGDPVVDRTRTATDGAGRARRAGPFGSSRFPHQQPDTQGDHGRTERRDDEEWCALTPRGRFVLSGECDGRRVQL
ncbi:Uncharacterised protein [Mycobacteroides abscessus]|nr:Uncharacterised protein [Mycobacteroides abscessus]